MMKKTAVLIGAACSLALGAGANTITFFTPAGATDTPGGHPVDASATFITGGNTVTIVLTDLLNNPTEVGQLISDITFHLTSGQTVATINPLPSTTTWRAVNGNGTFTDSTTPPPGPNNWAVDTSPPDPTTIHISALIGGAVGPAGLIIGGPGAGSLYSNAGGSIAGNGPHNPFLLGPVTFTLNVPGVNVDSSINSMSFSFGTTSGDDIPGLPPRGGVPDCGTTVMLLGAALSGLALIRRKLS
jgi:hypothetical protein